MMDFHKVQEELTAQYSELLAIHKILKEGFRAKSVDILFFDENKKAFFDKINKTRLYAKFLNQSSIIGKVYLDKKRVFIENITQHPAYHTAIDNPFKLDVENQLIIPSLKEGEIIGFVRLLGLEEFTSAQLPLTTQLDVAFIKIFTKERVLNEDEKIHDNAFVDRVKIFTTISQMKKLYNLLSDNARNQEVEKLIEDGRQNLNNIYTYLNPNFENVVRAQQARNTIDQDDKKRFNLLIADDLKINVQILKSMLSIDNIVDKIKLAYDGVEAVEVLEQSEKGDEHIHVIFLDHHMPGKSGTEIATQLKKEYDKENIIIVSITNDKEVIEKHKEIYDYHLPKPFTKDNVAKIMDKIKSEKLITYKK